jgi:hypothetical protein
VEGVLARHQFYRQLADVSPISMLVLGHLQRHVTMLAMSKSGAAYV